MHQLVRLFGFQLHNPLSTFTKDIANSELITGSRQLFVILLMQYAGWFLLIIPINCWTAAADRRHTV